MDLGFLINMILGIVGPLIFKPSNAAKYAKYLIKLRDYLLILLPLESFPAFQLNDPLVASLDKGKGLEAGAIDNQAVVVEAKKSGFNWPFIKGR